jgi:hypothetical protein
VVLFLVGCYCSLFRVFSSISGFIGSIGFLRVSFGCSCVLRLMLSLIKCSYL